MLPLVEDRAGATAPPLYWAKAKGRGAKRRRAVEASILQPNNYKEGKEILRILQTREEKKMCPS